MICSRLYVLETEGKENLIVTQAFSVLLILWIRGKRVIVSDAFGATFLIYSVSRVSFIIVKPTI